MNVSNVTVNAVTHGDIEISFVTIGWFVVGVRLDRLPSWIGKFLRPTVTMDKN